MCIYIYIHSNPQNPDLSRAKREQRERYEGLLPASQGQILALTVSSVPSSLDSGPWSSTARR